MKKKIGILIVGLFWGVFAYTQCVTQVDAFKGGEKLQFTGYFQWGFLWINAGKVTVETKESVYNGKSVWETKGVGVNARFFESFFKLRDTLVTKIDKKTLAPLTLDRKTNEGDYKARHVYTYNYTTHEIEAYIKKNQQKVKHLRIPFSGCVNNILSVLGYARNIDYSKHKKGDIIPMQMLVDGEISKVEVRYHGTDEVKTRRGYKFDCYKITPVLPDGTMFNGGDDMVIWLTNDKNRVPVMVEAKIPVGSVKGILENYEGLKNTDNVFGNTKGTFEKAKR